VSLTLFQGPDQLELNCEEIRQRTERGETTFHILAAETIADCFTNVKGRHMKVRDCFKFVPRSAAELDLVYYDGVRWQTDTGKAGLKFLNTVVCNVMASILGVSGVNRPAFIVGGNFTSSVVQQMQDTLFDINFFNEFNGDSTRKYVMYSDGLIEDRDTKAIHKGGPEHLCGLTCGFPYPADEIPQIHFKVSSILDIHQLMMDIKTQETMSRVKAGRFYTLPEDFKYHPGTIEKLDALAAVIPGLQAVRNSFKSWPPVLFLLKQLARARYAREAYEEVLFWFGRMGQNGKGLLYNLIKSFSGDYAKEPRPALFSAPETAEGTSTFLLACRGRRYLLVPELDRSVVLKSAFLKTMRDQSSEITARGLYRGDVSFSPQCLLVFSTNLWPQLSSIDGGVERSFTAMDFPITFSEFPQGDDQRQVDETLKSKSFMHGCRAGWIYLLRAVDDAYKSEHTTTVSPRPHCVVLATERLLDGNEASSIREFQETCIDLTTDWRAASTRPAIQRRLIETNRELSKKAAAELLQRTYSEVKVNGRDLLQVKGSCKYAKLK